MAIMDNPAALIARAVSLTLALPLANDKVAQIAVALLRSIKHLSAIIEPGWGWGNANIYIERWRFLSVAHTRSDKPER